MEIVAASIDRKSSIPNKSIFGPYSRGGPFDDQSSNPPALRSGQANAVQAAHGQQSRPRRRNTAVAYDSPELHHHVEEKIAADDHDENDGPLTTLPPASHTWPVVRRCCQQPGSPSDPRASLMGLPVEIRLQILSHLLFLPPSILSTDPSKLHPSILSTCHLLHAEGLIVLYRQNIFHAHPSLLTVFPRLRPHYAPIRPDHLTSLITRCVVSVRLDAEPYYERGRVTFQLGGKEEIVIDVWQASWRGAGPDVLRVFEGVRGVRRARVGGSILGFVPYARWLEGSMMRNWEDCVKPWDWDGDGDGEGGDEEV